MNILIIEVGGSHIECSYTFVHLLSLKKHKIHLICNENLFPLFPQKEQLSGYLLTKEYFSFWESIIILFKIRRYVRKHKIQRIIFNTTELKIVRNFFLMLPSGVKSFGVFHNAQKLEGGGTVKNIFSKKMKKYFLLGNDLISRTKIMSGLAVYPYFPVYFPPAKKINLNKPADEFWVTIPGAVNLERRDYLKLIELIKQQRFKDHIKFIFLGKNNLPAIIANEFYETDWWRQFVRTFNYTIDYDSFHNYLHSADIILPLIKIEDDVMYGTTRISGAYNAGMGHKKPFLLPHTVGNADIKPFSLYYKNLNEMVDIINDISENPARLTALVARYQSCSFLNFEQEADKISDYLELQ